MKLRRSIGTIILLALSSAVIPADVAMVRSAEPASAASGGASRAAQWPPRADLVREPERISLPLSDVVQESLRLGHTGLRGFLERQPLWKATVDPYAQGVDTAFGDGLDVPGIGAADAGDEEETLGRRFLEAHSEIFAPGLDLSSDSLVFDADAASALPDPEARFLRFDQQRDGIPVLGAGVTLAARGWRVFFVNTSALAPVATSPSPRLSPNEALASLLRYLNDSSLTLSLVRNPSLAFYPRLEERGAARILRHRLIWVLETRPAQARVWEGHVAYVDAHDATVLAFFPEARSVGTCNADPRQARGTVLGGVRANRAGDPERSQNLPFVKVSVDGTTFSSDLNGRFPYSGGVVTSALEGDFFRVHCDSCTNPAQPSATADESGDVDFGLGGQSAPSPVVGNGSSTPADRTTYFQLNEARQLLKKWNNAFFNEVDAFVNINSTCNAYSSGYMLGFFNAGGNCNNTGEIRDVVQHELGHTWDRTDGTGIVDGGLSEWKGDLMAVLAGGDSCIGESFRLSGGPSATCTGVRDVDERAAYSGTRTATLNGCGGEVHCVGEIPGQATWHLLYNLRTGTDYITGAALPAGNPGMSDEQARWILERLLIAGGPNMQTWDPASSGVSAYNGAIAADDDDGNLSNGTPHAAYINAAFGHHGLAESPQIADSADCAPLADPLVSTVVDRDPVTGLPRVQIDWTPVGGATSFDVYRNTRAGDAFLPLAQNVSAGPVVDVGVQVGMTYRYFVAAARKSGCAAISPGANIVTLTVVPPELRVGSKLLSEAPGGSDGDGLIEPGERVLVQVGVQEVGGSSGASAVTGTVSGATSTSSPIVSPGPVSFGTVPASGAAAADAPFEVFIGPSVPCNGKVHLTLALTGNEGCWIDGLDIPIAKVEEGCAASASAFVEVVPGSPTVVAGNGDADGIPDNCETTTVSYQLRNSGSLPSGPVLASVSTSQPGVTFVPRADCALADLGPGELSTCQFGFSLGGATSAGVPFTISANSSGNPALSRLDFTLAAELNPATFVTTLYNFEGIQGWTLQKFALSLVHPYAGARSLHAGSTTTANICAVATSPALRLSPTTPSTLTLRVWGDIEPLTDQWYDRANIHVIDLDRNTHVAVTPAGFPYQASGTPDGGLCHIPGQGGWAGYFPSWNLATFDLSPFQGHRIRVEVNYNSDEGDDRDGIYVDEMTITNSAPSSLPADAQGNSCGVPEVSARAAAVPLRVSRSAGDGFRWTWQDLGPAFQYSLYAGARETFYSHGANPLACQGRGAGVTCDGTSCGFDADAGSLPPGDLYFLVTATAYGTEGSAGFASNDIEREPAQSSCAP